MTKNIYSVMEKDASWWVVLVDEQGLDNYINQRGTEMEAREEARDRAKQDKTSFRELWAITHRINRTDVERELFTLKCFDKGREAAENLTAAGKMPADNMVPAIWKSKQGFDDASWEQFTLGWESFTKPLSLQTKDAPMPMTANPHSMMDQHSVPAAQSDVESVAAKLGTTATELGGSVITLRADLLGKIMQDGVLVDLFIGRWRAQTQLESKDLGIDEAGDTETQKVQREYLALGRRQLLPKELMNEIQRIESAARANLDHHAFKTPWGRFVSKYAWIDWAAKNNELRVKYMEIAARVAKESPQLFRQVMEDYEKMAPSIYARQMKKANFPTPPAAWMNDYRQRIASKFPTPQTILESFVFETTYAEVPIPTIQGWKSTGDTVLDSMRGDISKQMANSKNPASTQKGFYKEMSLQLVTDIHQVSNSALKSMTTKGMGKNYAIHPTTKESLDLAVARYRSRRHQEDANKYLTKVDEFVGALDAAISVAPASRDKKVIGRALIGVVKASESARNYFKNL